MFGFTTQAQQIIKGKVLDESTGEPLIGATVSGTANGRVVGTTSTLDGSFSLKSSADLSKVTVNFVGYLPQEFTVSGSQDLGVIKLAPNQVSISEVIVTGNMAIDRKTPVALSTIKAADIEERLGNKEFPEVLRAMPSMYVTKAGGGFGDSRMNVRGFSQENVAVMINGVPVNGMEDGRVYWSNWAGLQDIASNIQVQRGLGASKLSINAVGGNINIVTKATDIKKGGFASVAFGNDGYMKYTASVSSGKMANGLAFSLLGSYTQGNGYVDATGFKGWNYFATLAWEINSAHTLTLTATGAPQEHDQRSAAQPYQTYYGNPKNPNVKSYGPKYNNGWGYLDGKYFTMNTNFYHKPVFNLNHYWNISDKTELNSIIYASIGRGGGSGDFGRISPNTVYFLPRDANGLIRFDDIKKYNTGTVVPDFAATANTPWTTPGPYLGKYVVTSNNNRGIAKRSSMNEHNWYGVISNLSHHFTNQLTLNVGIDYRYYKGLHYRRLESTIGADAVFENVDVNNPEKYVVQGDKKTPITYNNDGYVQQIGGFTSLEYSNEHLDLFAAAAVSNTGYKREDFFIYKPEDPNRMTDWQNFLGYTFKAGGNYRINNQHNVFLNVGHFSRAPLFNSIFYANDNVQIQEDAKNEKVFGIEIGYGLRTKFVNANLNFYNTSWRDKSQIRSNTNVNERYLTTGLNALHKGIELDVTSFITRNLELTGMASIGDWRWKDNAQTQTYDDATNQPKGDPTIIYTDDVKVGDAAQTTFNIGAAYEVLRNRKVLDGIKLRASYFFADNLYAYFDPFSRNKPTDQGREAWKLPSYGLLDAVLSINFRLGTTRLTWRLNVDNVLDEKYLSEATSDYTYDPNDATDFEIGKNGSGKRNNVYIGFGRTWTTSLRLNF
jgi:hypothetical protein